MTDQATADTITIALVGNPNTGKSTLFNALTGVRQRVGNYPGVTVEKKIGHINIDGRRFELVDLPGTYSLAPRSADEMVAVEVLLGRRHDISQPNMVVCIVDAGNLERNLYLVSQVLELGLPTVVALNMVDLAAAKGHKLDVERLRSQLALPVVELQANRKIGISELRSALSRYADTSGPDTASPDTAGPDTASPDTSGPDTATVACRNPFPAPFQQEVQALEQRLSSETRTPVPRYLVERLLLDTSGYLQDADVFGIDGRLQAEVEAARRRLAEAGIPVPAIEAMARYSWVSDVLDGVIRRPSKHPVAWTDRIDHVLTHKLWGTLIFASLMTVVFQAIFSWAVPLMEGIEWLIAGLGGWLAATTPSGALQSLLVDGVIAGVGGVLVFLPQIFILFLFISVLEDCGYMARAAYLMDNLMSRVGLSGKSFIPLLSSFACAIPGIMATRVIEDRRDRLATILVAPLMSCSARLPVYTLLTAAFIPRTTYLYGWIGLQGVTLLAMYMVGIVAAVLVALVLKKTILKGPTPAFVMELPTYKVPSFATVLHRMFDRGWAFVRRAGTVILAVTVVVWAASYFPHNADNVEGPYRSKIAAIQQQILRLNGTTSAAFSGGRQQRLAELTDRLADMDKQIAADYLRQSILGQTGQLVEPFVKPLGWDWRIGCAVIASFPAREVVIGTLGVIYHVGSEQDEHSTSLRDKMCDAKWESGTPVFNIPVALSLMVFFALCAQCAATLVVIRRETGRWRWSIFTFVYMTALAYVGAFVVYQGGMLLLPHQ